MKHNIFKHAAVCTMALFMLSCVASYITASTEVAFTEGSNNRLLKFRLPVDIQKERHAKDDEGGFLREYQYEDGAVFYIVFESAALNNQVKLTSVPTHFLPNEKGFTASGADENGLFWKEVKINELIVGYKLASKSKAQHFDEAIQTMKWK